MELMEGVKMRDFLDARVGTGRNEIEYGGVGRNEMKCEKNEIIEIKMWEGVEESERELERMIFISK